MQGGRRGEAPAYMSEARRLRSHRRLFSACRQALASPQYPLCHRTCPCPWAARPPSRQRRLTPPPLAGGEWSGRPPLGPASYSFSPFSPPPSRSSPPPPPLSPVHIATLQRRPAKAPASAERAALGGTLWPVRPSRDKTTSEPPSPPVFRLGVPDGAPARLLVLTGGGKGSGGGAEPAGVRVVAARTCGEPDTAEATSKPRARVMGGRKRSYTEAMLAAATAALEDADREGFGTPQRDARARALPVRARRSSRRATSSPATVAAAAPAAAPSAAPETCGAAGPANADAGSDRRRITRLGATRLGTGSLGTAHSVKDSGEGSSRDDGGDGTRGDGGNDGGDGVRGNGAHYDVAGGHRRRHQVCRGAGGCGDPPAEGTDARAAVGRRRVTFCGVHGDSRTAGRGGLPLHLPTTTPPGGAESSAEGASTRSALV